VQQLAENVKPSIHVEDPDLIALKGTGEFPSAFRLAFGSKG